MIPLRFLTTRQRWLLAALTLVLFAWGGLIAWQQMSELDRPDWEGIDFASMPEVELLQEYIAIDTTSGKEVAGAEWLAGKLQEHGIEPQVETLATGQANLWAVIEGRRKEAVVLHHHIDVFRVDDEEVWDTPPFEGTILGPMLAGRGSFDMKSYGVAQLLAFLDIARSGTQPEYSLILLATSDEETGSRLGTRWFLREHPELVERFWVVLTEGGVAESFEEGEVRYWGVEVGQMQTNAISACAPTRERLEDLAADLALLPEGQVTVLPAVAEKMRKLADDRRQPRHQLAMAQPLRLAFDRRAVDGLPLFLRVLVEYRPQTAEIEETEDGYRMPMFAMRTPGAVAAAGDLSDLHDLIPTALLAGVDLAVDAHPGPAPSPTEHPVFETLTRRLSAVDGDAGPYVLAYTATDGRDFRDAGVTTYGYAPFAFVAAGMGPKDRGNERILLTSYVDGVAEYRAAVKEIVGSG